MHQSRDEKKKRGETLVRREMTRISGRRDDVDARLSPRASFFEERSKVVGAVAIDKAIFKTFIISAQ